MGNLFDNRTYNPVGLNKVSHFSRRGRAPTHCADYYEEIKVFVRLFVWKRILKNTLLPSKIHCYVKNRNGLYLNRHRSKMSSKTREVYLSSKHKRRGYLGGVWYQNRVLRK